MPKRVRLAKPYFTKQDVLGITRDINSILKSGWLTSGRFTLRFEDVFCKSVGTKFAVALNSGTAALHTMMAWLQLKSGDEVIVPANTFASTANAVLYEGGTPILADCDEHTFNTTASDIQAKISRKTKAAVVTHIAGNPCEMREIIKVCDEYGILLFEDSAHAIGSTYRGAPCGSFGSGAAFSLYPTKVITSAEGGILTTNNIELAEFGRLFRNAGRRSLGAGPIEILGHNYRLSEIHSSIGLRQMKHLSFFVRERNRLARNYSKMLSKACGDWIEPQFVPPYSRSAYYAYIVMLVNSPPIARDDLMKILREKYKIETTVMFRPIQTQPYFKRQGLQVSCPTSEAIGRNTLALPLHVGMTSEDVRLIADAIEEIAK